MIAEINRLLLVGYGSIGKRHLRIARESLPDADIRVLRHTLNNEKIDYSNGSFTELSEALAYKPQVAIIANPSPFHIATALALADLGCHMLIEKPLSDDLNGVSELILKARLRKCILQVGYNLRFLPSLTAYRNQIKSGRVGNILSVRCEIGQYLPSWRPDTDYTKNVSARKELGGGVLLELSHELDYLRWIFGEVEWVNAWVNRQSTLQINVEDTAHIILGFASPLGKIAPVASLCMDFIRHDSTRECIAIGDKGSLRWKGLSGEVNEFSEVDTEWKTVFNYPHMRDDSYRLQFEHFIYCIKNNLHPMICGEDGKATLKIIDAIKKSSSAEGSRVYTINKEK